ncbi:MAG: hypothetical protein ACI9XB_000705 [Gammaproteobacteria bacterium]|jgi:hypothetical protein
MQSFKKMMNYLKRAVLFLILLFSPTLFSQTAPPLGLVSSYVLYTSVGAVTNVGLSQVTGDFGTNSGAVSGFGNVNGQMHISDATTTQCAIDLGIAYTNLSGQIPGATLGLVLGAGQTLLPDVYLVPGAASLLGPLTLDACGDPNAIFVFQINGAFAAAAGSEVVLINGAQACNVFWRVSGQMSMATNTSFKGTIIADGAIPLATGVQLEGRAFTITGAISVNFLTAGIPLDCSNLLTGPVSPNIGALECFALIASNGTVTNTGTTNIVGDIGTNSIAPFLGFNPVGVTGVIHSLPDPTTAIASADLTTLHGELNGLPTDIVLLYPALFGNSQVLTPHVYVMNAAVTLTDTIFLDARGVADAVFVIRILGALTTNSNPQVVLVGGALAKNVFWQVEDAVTLSGSGNFKGIIVANNGDLVINSGVVLNGRVLSINGDITTTNVNITGTNTAAAASSLPTLCVNTTLTDITHATTGATGIGIATGLPPGVAVTWSGNTITISGTPAPPQGTYNYSIPLIGGCGSVNATGTIIVNDAAGTPTNTVTIASSMPTTCIDTKITNITHTTTGASGIGSVIGLPAGVIASWSANTITISGRPSVSGTFNYIIQLNGGCGSVNATGTITVTGVIPMAVNILSMAPTTCINTPFSFSAYTTSGATGVGFSTGLPPGVIATWSTDTITISGTPSSGGTFNYRIELVGGCGCVSATGTIIVSVIAGPVADITTASTSICPGVLSTLSGNVTATGAWTLTLSDGQTTTGSGNGVWSLVVAPTTTTIYTISSLVDASPCASQSSDSVTLTLPLQGANISNDNDSSSCLVNQADWVHFYHVSGRLIASVNSNGQNLGNVSVTSYVDVTNQIIPPCSSPSSPYSTVVMQRHWVVTPSIQPVTPVLVRLPFNDSELTTLSTLSNSNLDSTDGVNTIADIKLSKYSGPLNVDNIFSNNCVSAGGNEGTTIHTQSASGITTTYSAVTAAQFTDFSIPGFSELWLHGSSINSPLPIELLSFTALVKNEHVELNWVTASEINNDYFDIERSVDGINFTSISTINGAGNSTQNLFYSMVDLAPLNGMSYYRLKQTDYDGATSYSSLEVVEFIKINNIIFDIYPNPFSGQTIFRTTEKLDDAELVIYNSTGNIVKQIQNISGQTCVLHCEDLSRGFYFISLVQNNTILATDKIVIRN